MGRTWFFQLNCDPPVACVDEVLAQLPEEVNVVTRTDTTRAHISAAYQTVRISLGYDKMTITLGQESGFDDDGQDCLKRFIILSWGPWWRGRWNKLPNLVIPTINHVLGKWIECYDQDSWP